jgi:hypothetical protein
MIRFGLRFETNQDTQKDEGPNGFYGISCLKDIQRHTSYLVGALCNTAGLNSIESKGRMQIWRNLSTNENDQIDLRKLC